MRRQDMAGTETAGIDRVASCKLYKSAKLTPYQKGLVRSIMCGAVWTGHRLAKAKLCASGACRFCQLGEVEDEHHLWWRCPKWDYIRRAHKIASFCHSADWPPCLDKCGLVPAALPVDGTLFAEAIESEDEDSEHEHGAEATSGMIVDW